MKDEEEQKMKDEEEQKFQEEYQEWKRVKEHKEREIKREKDINIRKDRLKDDIEYSKQIMFLQPYIDDKIYDPNLTIFHKFDLYCEIVHKIKEMCELAVKSRTDPMKMVAFVENLSKLREFLMSYLYDRSESDRDSQIDNLRQSLCTLCYVMPSIELATIIQRYIRTNPYNNIVSIGSGMAACEAHLQILGIKMKCYEVSDLEHREPLMRVNRVEGQNVQFERSDFLFFPFPGLKKHPNVLDEEKRCNYTHTLINYLKSNPDTKKVVIVVCSLDTASRYACFEGMSALWNALDTCGVKVIQENTISLIHSWHTCLQIWEVDPTQVKDVEEIWKQPLI